jgi:hypothetical protein
MPTIVPRAPNRRVQFTGNKQIAVRAGANACARSSREEHLTHLCYEAIRKRSIGHQHPSMHRVQMT